jgi:hypothetical protein
MTIVAIAIIEAAVLTNREIGSLAFGSLAFGSWQGRSNQRAMDRPFVLRVRAGFGLFLHTIERLGLRSRCGDGNSLVEKINGRG